MYKQLNCHYSPYQDGKPNTIHWVTADCDLDLQLEPQLESNHQAAIMNCVSQKKGTPSVTILLQNYNIVKIIKVWLIFTAPLPLC